MSLSVHIEKKLAASDYLWIWNIREASLAFWGFRLRKEYDFEGHCRH